MSTSEHDALVGSIKVWTEEELLYSMSAGLLKPTADTQSVIEDPNITGLNVTIITGQGIGNTTGKVSIDVATVRTTGLTTDQRIAFAAADRPDLTYVGGNIIIGQFNFSHGASTDTITRLDGGSWTTDGFTVGMSVQVEGKSLNTTAKAVNYKIASVSGSTITLTSDVRLVATESNMAATLTPVTVDPTAAGAVVKTITIDQRNDVNVEMGGKLNVSAGTNIFLGTTGNFSIENISAGTAVRIKAKGDIANVATSGVNVASSDLILEAGLGAIGTGPTPFLVNLSANAGAGLTGTLTARAFNDVYISTPASVDMRVEGVSSQARGVYLQSGGSMLDGLNSDSAKIAASRISLTALGGTIGTLANFLETDALGTPSTGAPATGTITATATGSIYLHETLGDMNVDGIKSTAGDVYLRAQQSILDASTRTGEPASKPGTDIYGKNINLTSDLGRIGISGNDLDIDSSYSATGALTLSSFLGSNIIETVGDLVINQIKAGLGLTSDNIAFIKAIDGSIVNGRVGSNTGAGNSNLLSGRAYLFAKNNIGAAGTGVFTTEAGALEGQATLGSAYITNTGAMTVGGVTGEGLTSQGPLNLSAHSPITIASNVTSDTDITITSGDSAGTGDDVTIDPTFTVWSKGGSVTVQAGDNFWLPTGATIRADGAGKTVTTGHHRRRRRQRHDQRSGHQRSDHGERRRR